MYGYHLDIQGLIRQENDSGFTIISCVSF